MKLLKIGFIYKPWSYVESCDFYGFLIELSNKNSIFKIVPRIYFETVKLTLNILLIYFFVKYCVLKYRVIHVDSKIVLYICLFVILRVCLFLLMTPNFEFAIVKSKYCGIKFPKDSDNICEVLDSIYIYNRSEVKKFLSFYSHKFKVLEDYSVTTLLRD